MSKFDIMPYRGSNQGNVLPAMDEFPLASAETFTVGEIVSVNNAGNLTEAADDPADEDAIGIAAMSGDTVGTTDPIGIFRSPDGLFTPGASPNLPVANDLIGVWLFKDMGRIVSRNFATDGAGTLTTPTKANAVGEVAGFSLTAGQWSIDVGTTNKLVRITTVLDANGRDIARSGGTGVAVVAVPIAHELATIDAPAA